ncbi:hypothetical protein CY35_05G144300 [Sphagnum magellanicum]|nr:hypothetical protein CY35_05G144300 [Sphagnum magellanicum]
MFYKLLRHPSTYLHVADAKPVKQILASGNSGMYIFTGTSSTEFCDLSSRDAYLNWGADRYPIPLLCGHRTWMERYRGFSPVGPT